MGMFDTFVPSEGTRDTFKCHCGGELHWLQTKDFDRMLVRIVMKEDWTLEIKEGDDEERQYWRVIKDTRYANVYSDCRDCGKWNEWRLHVREGRVVEIVRVPEREGEGE